MFVDKSIKTAALIHLPKVGNRIIDPSKSRPISLTSVLYRTYERLVKPLYSPTVDD